MSGGKSGATPSIGLPEVCIAVLAAGGVAAYENLAGAVELERVIHQERLKYERVLREYRAESDRKYAEYQKALRIAAAAERAAASATTIATSRPAAAQQPAQRPAQPAPAAARESTLPALHRQIIQAAEPLVTQEWSGQTAAKRILAEAEAILQNQSEAEAVRRKKLEAVIKKLAMLEAGSGPAMREAESLKAEYLSWVAKINVLNKVLERPMILTRPFNVTTAAQEITRMQKQHDALAKELDLVLRGGNCPEDARTRRKKVANNITRTMEGLGLTFMGRSEREKMESSYFKFHSSVIRASVTDTGRVAFDLVGVPGQTVPGVVSDMERFETYYHNTLAPALAAAGVPIFLFSESAPGADIVRYLSDGEIETTEPTAGVRRSVEELRQREVGYE